ncbi:phospholipase D-like domain-containing protein [Teichococcus vastitatis]|uniref:Phospholipase D-like domain-containing protein n=1 Tax=Teichococcus vastitatis TaxID=2307076 RepID=A0ABS9WAD0_9PROT|nr:hypothetical protein [Pseudoroseomonas vastitatis]MCI0755544.1 hypothetical protein [Pseudoroseomonas vastitatis]
MRLYERLGDTGYHTAIISSFGIDFEAFETIALSRLRGAGCRNVVLIADAAMVGLALNGGSPPPRSAGAHYLLVKASASGGVFHPKIFLQLGRKGGRMIVASANATGAGLAGNLELASLIECGGEDSGEQRLIAAGWAFLRRFLDERQQAVADKMDWARARTPWLLRARPAEGLETLVDGTQAAFIASGVSGGIGARFCRMVGDVSADRLIVLSPYWDERLAALRQLQERLDAADTAALIDTAQGLFPTDALRNGRAVRVGELAGFDERRFPKRNSRFVHAKLIVATTGDTDHVLVGSANCTLAALGRGDEPGINEEACLYRRVPAGRVLDELGLTVVANGGRTVDVADIPAYDPGEELPLDDARASDPGTFEAVFDRLRWWPSSPALGTDVARGSAIVELIANDDAIFDVPLEAAATPDTSPLAFSIPAGAARPRLARVRFQDGRRSGAAVVACVGELRSETREPMGSRGEKAAAALDDAQEEGLWLLEILDDLEAADRGAGTHPPSDAMVPRGPRVPDRGTGQPQMLDYAAFLAGRRRRVEPGERERNSLAGSASSRVRAFLNRALGVTLAGAEAESRPDDDREILRALDTGDEVSDGASAIEGGLELGQTAGLRAKTAHPALRRLADARAFGDAVNAFGKRIVDAKEIGAKDLLRLRALLTAIAIAGFGEATRKPTAVQVLPTAASGSAEAWPRLMGRALNAFFGGREPAVRRLELEAVHDRLPTDVLETWATCIWAGETALAASRCVPSLSALVPILERLVAQMTLWIALTPEERSSRDFIAVREALDARFQERLGLRRSQVTPIGRRTPIDA